LYTHADPINEIDPSGELAILPILALSAFTFLILSIPGDRAQHAIKLENALLPEIEITVAVYKHLYRNNSCTPIDNNGIKNEISQANKIWAPARIKFVLSSSDIHEKRMTVIQRNGILPMSSYGVPSGNTNFFGNDPGKIQIHYVMSFVPYHDDSNDWDKTRGFAQVDKDAVLISVQKKNSNTLAHEFGHILGLSHIDTSGNLMHPRTNFWYPALNQYQVDEARQNTKNFNQ
jgi:hypothetical protein